MINVQLSTGSGVRPFFSAEGPLRASALQNRIEQLTGCLSKFFYLMQNGRLMNKDDVCELGYVTVVPRLLGGKGGFGSMLRAIGAQIEKTTNREACRDLSGRRLRDINEEKRLKAWIEKQGKREEEAVERKKKKLERLRAEPRHEFKDRTYEHERSVLTERVGDAVEEGFKAASTTGVKRKQPEEPAIAKPVRKKTLLDMDMDSDELDSSDSSDSDEPTRSEQSEKPQSTEDQASRDSGHDSNTTDEKEGDASSIVPPNAELKETNEEKPNKEASKYVEKEATDSIKKEVLTKEEDSGSVKNAENETDSEKNEESTSPIKKVVLMEKDGNDSSEAVIRGEDSAKNEESINSVKKETLAKEEGTDSVEITVSKVELEKNEDSTENTTQKTPTEDLKDHNQQ